MNISVDGIISLGPLLATLALAVVVLWFADRQLIRNKKTAERHPLLSQLGMIALSIAAAIAVILSLPVDDSLRAELFGLLGLVITALVAFASTTFVANIMAGLMLRAVRSFSPGDFIEAGAFFGKVTERNLFHTEIQSEDRDLITLPNMFLATNPVKVVRSSGTAINCLISLGYDVPHRKVESLLKEAALAAELEDPFVQILELGDFSITYKAVGFCPDVQQLLSRKSGFKACILDVLHGAGVEIVSPVFQNQRVVAPDRQFIPRGGEFTTELSVAEIFPESLLFDKANKARRIQLLEEKGADLKEQIAALKDADPQQVDVEAQRRQLESQLRISKLLLEREQNKEEE